MMVHDGIVCDGSVYIVSPTSSIDLLAVLAVLTYTNSIDYNSIDYSQLNQ